MSYLENSGSISSVLCFQMMVSYFCGFHGPELRLNKLPFNSTQLSVITLCKQTQLNLFSFLKGEKGQHFQQKDCHFSICCKFVLYWKHNCLVYHQLFCVSLQTLYIVCFRHHYLYSYLSQIFLIYTNVQHWSGCLCSFSSNIYLIVCTSVCMVSLTTHSFASKKVAIPGDLLFNAINITQTIYLYFYVIFIFIFNQFSFLKAQF